jgi:SAM-dependent methyltransferase
MTTEGYVILPHVMSTVTEVETSATRPQTASIVYLFAPTLFLSAFLLFCFQPMVGKMMLPLLGGAASVWITCVLFFQLMLLAGYGYAHVLERYATLRGQILIHSAMMVGALLFLPIQFGGRPDESASLHPTLWLLWHLLKSVGIPFCIVSTTAPLLQNWLSKTPNPSGRDPYFLYAVSNAGSLIALLAYPVLIEPRLGVRVQSWIWLAGYSGLVLLVFTAGALMWRHLKANRSDAGEQVEGAADSAEAPGWRLRLYWVAAAFVPSALMLAVTNHILVNLASVPFLWIIPLATYLVTFMIAFGRRIHLSPLLLSSIVPVVLLLLFPFVASSRPVPARWMWYLMGAHIVILFAGALLCHTALAARRPSPRHLTEFYVWIAVGGALGGAFTAVAAPSIFSSVIEYPLLVAMIAFFRETRDPDRSFRGTDLMWPAGLGFLVIAASQILHWARVDVFADLTIAIAVNAVLILVAYLFRNRQFRFAVALVVLIASYHRLLPQFLGSSQMLYVARDFFGVKGVKYDLDSNSRRLLHGDTLHGLESQDPTLSGQPLSYYHETGPIGDVMKMLAARPDQRIGVVGLGTGSMAGWTAPNRHITFFDIDPQMHDIAHGYFTFLRRCAENCDVVIGDGRLSIEKLNDGELDLLLLDAFSSDSIPAHLVSREAIQMYLTKLKPDGLIMFHVSNRYMDVESLISAAVTDAALPGLVRYDNNEEHVGKTSSDYVIAGKSLQALGLLVHNSSWSPVRKPEGIEPWTDDYSNMLEIVRWK